MVDKILLDQLVQHLHSNQLIPHHHHGGFNKKSTVTALTTIINTWANCIESSDDAIAIAMDQLKAFEIVDHQLLMQKLQLLGLDYHSVELMQSYLADHTQVVYLEGFTSNTLHTGPRSVFPGSGVSCTLYLIFMMDLPLIFENEKKPVRQSEVSSQLDSLTYIDDSFVTVKQKQGEDIQITLLDTIQWVETYMAANLLMLNMKFMVLKKNTETRKIIKIPAKPKDISYSKHLKILGINVAHDLNWKFFLLDGKAAIYKQLVTRVNALKILKQYTSVPVLKKHLKWNIYV